MTGSLSNIRKNRRHKSHLLDDEKSREAQFNLALPLVNPHSIGQKTRGVGHGRLFSANRDNFRMQ
jgi:hypothetical protein